MKKNLFAALLGLFLIITTLHAQSGNKKVDDLMSQIKKQTGSISFKVVGKSYELKAGLFKTTSNKTTSYVINGGFMGTSNTIAVVLNDIKPGVYHFLDKKSQSSLYLENDIYLIDDGSITIKTSGNQVSGTFQGKLFPPDGKGKFSQKSTKTITGTFSGLTL